MKADLKFQIIKSLKIKKIMYKNEILSNKSFPLYNLQVNTSFTFSYVNQYLQHKTQQKDKDLLSWQRFEEKEDKNAQNIRNRNELL